MNEKCMFYNEKSYNIDDNEVYTQIAKKIYIHRIKKGLSVRELALMSDVSERYLNYIEAGAKHTTLPTLLRIAKALDIDISTLLEE